jgi:hypothetical protein
MSGQTCKEYKAQTFWRGAARRISDATTAYLSPPELVDIWGMVRSAPCYREAADDNRAWVDLFAAISQRDAPKIVSLVTTLLAPSSPKSKDELAYLTTVGGAAYLQMGQIPEAGRLLEAQVSYLKDSGQYALPLQELWALTRVSRTGGPATTVR